MTVYLLDNNHLGAAIRKVSEVRDRIYACQKNGDKFVTCFPALCELEAGIQQTAKPTEYRRRLNNLMRHVKVWPIDHETTQEYGRTFNELRRLGRVLSQIDIILAAMARQHNLTLLTTDKDFEVLEDVATENWLV